MRNRWIFLVLFAAPPALAAADVEMSFYVAAAPAGSDQNSGTRAAPFATLDRARLAVRNYREAHPARGEIVVEMRGGLYELTAPVRFEAKDSGERGKAIVYKAAAGERVIVSGGKRVSGWRDEGNGVLAAEVGTGVDFRQLWIGSRRAVRARTPNAGEYLTMSFDKQSDGFDLPGDLLKNVTVRPREVEVAVTIAWMHKRLRIERVASGPEGKQVRAVIAEPEWDAVTKQPQGDRVYSGRTYWLENAPEFLDAPGEFYLDRPAGLLRYRMRTGEDLAQIPVVRPVLENLIVLGGTLDAPVHDIRFEGLVFSHTGWTRPNRSGFVDVQANSLVPANPVAAVDSQYRHDQRKDRVPAAVQATTADRIVIRGCRFLQLGGTGVMFTHGGDDNVVEGNSFYDLAAGGVEFGEDAAAPLNERLFPRRNRISNNFIAHIGEDYWGSVGILGYYTDALEISHNEITSIPYTAISVGWGWGKPSAPAASRNNRIIGNRVSNFMRRLDDGGGIYTTDRLLGSEIAYNVVSQMLPPDKETKAGGALYLDQFTEGVHVHHNLVTEALRWLFIWNPNIRGNRVESNAADTEAQRNDGTDNIVESVNLLSHEAAFRRKLVADAGIEPAFAAAREFSISDVVVVESCDTDVYFERAREAITGPDSDGSSARRLAGKGAAVRIWPVLPKSGVYEITLEESYIPPSARVVVRGADGAAVDVSSAIAAAAPEKARELKLGRFTLEAGAGTEISVSLRDSNTDLIFGRARLTRVAD